MKLLNVNVNGNKKLVNNDKVRFIIWNLQAIDTCPYATELCKCNCYARKSERCYPQVLPSRLNNYLDSLKADFVDNMIHTIEKELNSRKFKGKKAVFRIHESGDFYSKEYAEKWVQIASHFLNDDRIVFMAYTKSIFWLDNAPNNMVVRASVWDDTDAESLEYIESHNLPIYTAVDNFNAWSGAKCRCKDCATCGMCWNKNVKNIACEIH